MTQGFKRGAATGLLIAMVVGGFAGGAAAQDASQGYRLWNFISTIKGTAANCALCHGADPRMPPNAMLGIGSINPACNRTDWPIGTAHALKGLCNIGSTATQTDAEARLTVGLGVPLMAQFAAAGLTAPERRDLAAFLLASHLGTPVLFARPEFQVEPSTTPAVTFDFGQIAAGTTLARTVFFVNSGTAAMQIDAGFNLSTAITGSNAASFIASPTVGATTCAAGTVLMANGGRCGVTVTFSPTIDATQTATLTIPSNGGSGRTQLSFLGSRVSVPVPNVVLAPAAADYAAGTTPGGTRLDFAPITLRNAGPVTLNINTITIAGTNATDFSLANGSCANGTVVAASGGTCTLQFVFAPPTGATGPRSASVEIVSNAPTSPTRFTLSGIAGTVTPTIGFGTSSNTNQAFLRLQANATGVAANGVVTIRNPGAAGAPPLTITGIQLSSGSPTFSIAPGATNCLSAPVPAGSNCTINVTYTAPDMAVPHSGNIIVTSDGRTTGGTAGPHSVVLEGTVVVAGSGSTSAQAPNAPQAMQFQNTPVNTLSTQVQRVQVNNTGGAALTVQVRLGAGTQSDFTAVNGCTSIAAGNSCFVDIGFRPRNEGVRNDTLTLTYNGGALPAIQLSGTGQAANLAGQGAGGGALSLPWLLALALGTLLAARTRRRGLARLPAR